MDSSPPPRLQSASGGAQRQAVVGSTSALRGCGCRQSLRACTEVLLNLGRARRWAAAVASLSEARDWSLEADAYLHGVGVASVGRCVQWTACMGMLVRDAGGPAFGAALSACERMERWTCALRLCDAMQAWGHKLDPGGLTAATGACSRVGRWTLASGMLFCHLESSGIEPVVATCSAAVSVCVRAGEWRLALREAARLPARGLEPIVSSCNAAISACELSLQWRRTLEVLRALFRSELVPTSMTCSAAVAALGRGLHWASSLLVVGRLQGSGAEANLVVDNAMVSACERGKRWELSLQLLTRIRCDGVSPNLVTYITIICACGEAARWESASVYLTEEMARVGVMPNVIAFNAALAACADASVCGVDGASSHALSMLALMHEWHLRPDLVTYSVAATAAVVVAAAPSASATVPRSAAADLLADCSRAMHATLATDSSAIASKSTSPDVHGAVVAIADVLRYADSFGGLAGAALWRHVAAPTMPALKGMLRCGPGGGGGPQLRDAALERIFGLGDVATVRALSALSLVDLPFVPWRSIARRSSLDVLLHYLDGTVALGTSPAAQALAAWVAASGPSCAWPAGAGNLLGSQDEAEAGATAEVLPQLRPLSVAHDRAPHAERTALLSALSAVLGARRLRGDDVTVRRILQRADGQRTAP